MKKIMKTTVSFVITGLFAIAMVIITCVEYPQTNPFDSAVNGNSDTFGLVAEADTNLVRLFWDAVNIPTLNKYAIYRSADSLDFSLLKKISGESKTEFADSLVSPDSTYYYRVTLFAKNIESNYSFVVSARPLAAIARFEIPDTVFFDSTLNQQTFVIGNIGSTAISKCTFSSSQSWITILPTQTLRIPGGVSRDIEVTIDRTDPVLATGPNIGFVLVEADVITRTLVVKAIKKSIPQLFASVNGLKKDTLNFSLNLTSLQVNLANIGGGVLRISGITPSASWITAVLSDSSINSDGAGVLTVSVIRDSLAIRNNPYSGSISILSNGGTAIMVISALHLQNTPFLSVTGDTIDLDSTKSVAQFTINNAGTAAMKNCSLSTSEDWTTVDPALITALASAGSRSVSVTVDRSSPGLKQGWNTAFIVIESDGGNASKTVRLYHQGAPLLSITSNNAPVSSLDFGLTLSKYPDNGGKHRLPPAYHYGY